LVQEEESSPCGRHLVPGKERKKKKNTTDDQWFVESLVFFYFFFYFLSRTFPFPFHESFVSGAQGRTQLMKRWKGKGGPKGGAV